MKKNKSKRDGLIKKLISALWALLKVIWNLLEKLISIPFHFLLDLIRTPSPGSGGTSSLPTGPTKIQSPPGNSDSGNGKATVGSDIVNRNTITEKDRRKEGFEIAVYVLQKAKGRKQNAVLNSEINSLKEAQHIIENRKKEIDVKTKIKQLKEAIKAIEHAEQLVTENYEEEKKKKYLQELKYIKSILKAELQNLEKVIVPEKPEILKEIIIIPQTPLTGKKKRIKMKAEEALAIA